MHAIYASVFSIKRYSASQIERRAAWDAAIPAGASIIIRKRAARAVVRRTERVPVILAGDELAVIEEFRFQARRRDPRLICWCSRWTRN